MNAGNNMASNLGRKCAFPQPDDGFRDGTDYGMTYRQWLVGMALQGILSRNDPGIDYAADVAIAAADTVISKLERLP